MSASATQGGHNYTKYFVGWYT